FRPVFFFSGSRRHTRSKRDWSSDVCSSDLRRKAVEMRLGIDIHARLGHGQSDYGLLVERTTDIKSLWLSDDRQPVRKHVKYRDLAAGSQVHAETHRIGVLKIGRAHVGTPVTFRARKPSSA